MNARTPALILALTLTCSPVSAQLFGADDAPFAVETPSFEGLTEGVLENGLGTEEIGAELFAAAERSSKRGADHAAALQVLEGTLEMVQFRQEQVSPALSATLRAVESGSSRITDAQDRRDFLYGSFLGISARVSGFTGDPLQDLASAVLCLSQSAEAVRAVEMAEGPEALATSLETLLEAEVVPHPVLSRGIGFQAQVTRELPATGRPAAPTLSSTVTYLEYLARGLLGSQGHRSSLTGATMNAAAEACLPLMDRDARQWFLEGHAYAAAEAGEGAAAAAASEALSLSPDHAGRLPAIHNALAAHYPVESKS